MKTLPPILNRDFCLPDDGKVHLVPKGVYPVEHAGKKIIQVVDEQALAAIVQNLGNEVAQPNFGGLCIDFEHFRHDPDKESRAGGWLDSGLENRSNGLFGAPRWSTSGKAAVEGGDYRFISPEFDPSTLESLGGDRYRVTRLVGFGLTNNPNMRGMTPLSNRSGGAPGGFTDPDADQKQTHTSMKKVTSLLGLADGADENQIAGAIEALQSNAGKVPALTNRVTELTTINETLVGESIDADLAAHGVTDAEVISQVKPVLVPMKNRADRVKFLGLFRKPTLTAAAKTPLTNRAAAQTPVTGATTDPDAPTKEDTARSHAIVNRARSLRASDKTLSNSAAYQRAANQIDSELAAAARN